MLKKGTVEALKKSLGASSLVVPIAGQKTAISIGELAELALRQLRRQPPQSRKFRFANPGEVTVFQKQSALEAFAQGGNTRARLVWVHESDIIDMGEEVKPQGKQ